MANDLEQTLARVFTTMEGIITHNPEFAWEAEVQARTIYLTNGTTATAISGDYAGAGRGLRQCAAGIPKPADDFRRMRGHRGPSGGVGLNPIIEDTVGGYWEPAQVRGSRAVSLCSTFSARQRRLRSLRHCRSENYSSNHLAGGATRRIGGTSEASAACFR